MASSAGTGSSAPRPTSGIPDLVYDNHPVDQPTPPEEGYHLTDDITDKALEFIKDAKAIAPDKPFFLYYAPGACHAPHHAPKEWIDKFKGRFDMGYEAHARADAGPSEGAGHRPGGHRAAADQPDRHARDPHRARTASRSRCSTPPGRGTRCPTTRSGCSPGWPRSTRGSSRTPTTTSAGCSTTWRTTGQLENTLVDPRLRQRRVSGEGGPNGSVNEMKFVNGIPDDLAENLADARRARQPEDLQPLPERLGDGVQHAVQDVEALRVQRRHADPCIISWPAGIKARGEIRHQYHHAIDIVPTILDVLGVEPPETIKGHVQSRVRRRQHALQLRRRGGAVGTAGRSSTRCSGRAAIWHEGWKAVTTHPTIAGWSHFNDDEWELYHTDVDRSELHDLAGEHPDKLRELVNLWFAEAGAQRRLPARRPLGRSRSS